MEQKVNVTIDGVSKQYDKFITYEAIAKEYQEQYQYLICAVVVNGKIRELIKRIDKDCIISFITQKDAIGHKIYVRTAILLMMKAIHDIVGTGHIRKIKVEFTVGNGLYCSGEGDFSMEAEFLTKVTNRMRELIDSKAPITKKAYAVEDAIELFQAHGMYDKVKLFRYRRSAAINVYEIEGFHDYYYGYMFPSADYVTHFKLELYEEGLLLILPNQKTPKELMAFEPRKKFFRTLQRGNEWGTKLGIDTVGDLNDQICEGSLNKIILIQEALQERRIGEIARDIEKRGGVKFIMIAGPSSSGKTTFSHRLSVQLGTLGFTPHPIAVDNYFVNRSQTPLDENGVYNFECLEAIDVEQFNDDMAALLAGEEIELPSFNFKTGQREYKGNVKKLGRDDILVIEGIHGLNPKMSYELPDESKYKIYISALTTLNIDEHNRIPTTDGRMIRRIVRDARTRGTSAKKTIQMWPSVRAGEEENIFPFQESADAMFNSALIYELSVLKQFAEPLLFHIEKGEPEYFEAKRLLKFLEYFLGVSSENLPNNSIIREFVGGSCFHV